ncbi:hypothetical protein J2T13_000917 [Paenibacillus sp. DS2015]|uniref:hypothetical protein n=1 Tax=Paenibacillus sp. DS2015 TaxID=3373917 RepID=UPI003D201C51
MKKIIGKMLILSILAMGISFFTTTGLAFADSEALYRTGTDTNPWQHAGVRKGGVGVYEIKGYNHTVDLNTFASFVGTETYLGAFTNPLMTATDKSKVQSTLALMEADTDINYVGLNMIDADFNPGEYLSPDEIDDIRCDGVVEYAYEWNNIPVWGRTDTGTSSGTPTHFDVSKVSYISEHQNLGGNQPWFEASPLIQRGGAGTAWTKLRQTTPN